MYGIDVEDFNYAAVFGIAFGIYIISNIELLAREALTFVKGWNN